MSKKKKIIVLSVCICLALALMGGTLAWYTREEGKRARTDGATVMAPYNLYLLNPDAEYTLQFAVGNLHPGETKQTVICVSNMRPKDYTGDESDMSELAKESEFGYDLMLVHTENLAVNYKVYPLTRHDITPGQKLTPDDIVIDDDTNPVVKNYYWTKDQNKTLEGDDITPEMRTRAGTDMKGIVNAGTYWLSSDENDMKLAYTIDANGIGHYEYDYYLIEIDWQDIKDFDSYRKETDMVYVVVNAKQPRPILIEESTQPDKSIQIEE